MSSDPRLPIVIVTAQAWFGDAINGRARMATEFARALARQQAAFPKYRVVFLSCHASVTTTLANLEMVDLATDTGGCHLVRYAAPKEKASPCCRLRHHLRGARRIVMRLARTERILAVSGHSPLQTLGAMQGLRRARVTCPVTYVVYSPFSREIVAHGTDRRELNEQTDWLTRRNFHWRTCCATACAHRLERRLLNRCSRIQTLSQSTRNLLEKEFGAEIATKTQILPAWVDTQRFQPENRGAARMRLPQPWRTEEIIFFANGRSESRAGFSTLIDAVALLREENRERPFRVLIGENGPRRLDLPRHALEKGLGSTIRFVGRLSEDELPFAYAAADAFLLPALALDSAGLSVLESFASGTPVVAADTAAPAELITRTGKDWLFPHGDARALADRLSRILRQELRPEVDPRELANLYAESVLFPIWSDLHVP